MVEFDGSTQGSLGCLKLSPGNQDNSFIVVGLLGFRVLRDNLVEDGQRLIPVASGSHNLTLEQTGRQEFGPDVQNLLIQRLGLVDLILPEIIVGHDAHERGIIRFYFHGLCI